MEFPIDIFFGKYVTHTHFVVRLTFIFCVKVLHMYNTLCYYSNEFRDFEYFKTKYAYSGFFCIEIWVATKNYWILFNRVFNYKKLCFVFFLQCHPTYSEYYKVFFIRRSRIKNNVQCFRVFRRMFLILC